MTKRILSLFMAFLLLFLTFAATACSDDDWGNDGWDYEDDDDDDDDDDEEDDRDNEDDKDAEKQDNKYDEEDSDDDRDNENKKPAKYSEGLAYYYSDAEGGNIIIGVGNCKDNDVVIPAEIDGKPVVALQEMAFWNCITLRSVVIPEGVKYVGARTFECCYYLESVVFPESLETIGYDAFAETNLMSVHIPKNVKEIYSPFKKCNLLSEITVDPQNSVFHSAGNCIIETAAARLVSGCKTSVIPADGSVREIGSYSFSGCHALEQIIIPDTVKTIGDNAFEYCIKLRSINIPLSVFNIGSYAFDSCLALGEIHCEAQAKPSGWKDSWYGYDGHNRYEIYWSSYKTPGKAPTYDQIAERPGNESSGLEYTYTEGVGLIITGIGSCKDKDIVIPEWIDGFPVVSIASQAFVGANIKSVYIPKTVKFVGFYAFASCESLETVVLPPNIDMIKQETFRGCSSLKNITIPERVTQIGPQSFGGCSSLEEINIPYGVTFIGNNAFAGSSIKSIYLPDSVQNIEYGAFYKCKYLTTVYIPKSVTSVGNDVFAECDNLRGIYCECFSVPNGWNANWNRNCGAEVYLAQSVRPDIYYPIIDPAVNDNIGICVSNASVKANNISGYSSAFSGFAETNISLNASAKELKCYPSISLPDIIPEGGSVHYTFSIDPFYNVSESKLSDYVVIVSDFVISAEGYEDIISPGYVMDMPKDLESKYLDLWYVAYNYFGTEERAISYIESINKITFNVSVKPRAFARQNRF